VAPRPPIRAASPYTTLFRSQLHDRACIQAACLAPLVDAFAFHQRHGEPAGAVVGDAGVDEAGDVGVAQAGEDPGLALEALAPTRSEEHTSALQSRENLVCRL